MLRTGKGFGAHHVTPASARARPCATEMGVFSRLGPRAAELRPIPTLPPGFDFKAVSQLPRSRVYPAPQPALWRRARSAGWL